jgi:hypothetical protein
MFQDISSKNGRKLKSSFISNDIPILWSRGGEKNMNSKGQIGLGMFLIAFIGIIVAVTLFQTVAQDVGKVTSTYTATAAQYTPAAAESSVDLTGQELVTLTAVVNDSGDYDCESNFTIAEGVSPRTGTKRVIMTSVATYSSAFCGKVNVTYTYAPEGYIDNSAGRSIALLIPILAALAIMVIALVPSLRSGVMDMLKK